ERSWEPVEREHSSLRRVVGAGRSSSGPSDEHHAECRSPRVPSRIRVDVEELDEVAIESRFLLKLASSRGGGALASLYEPAGQGPSGWGILPTHEDDPAVRHLGDYVDRGEGPAGRRAHGVPRASIPIFLREPGRSRRGRPA